MRERQRGGTIAAQTARHLFTHHYVLNLQPPHHASVSELHLEFAHVLCVTFYDECFNLLN